MWSTQFKINWHCCHYDVELISFGDPVQLIRIIFSPFTCSGSREARVLPACRAISVCCSTVGPGGVNNTNIKHKSSNHNKKIQMLCLSGFTQYLQVSLQRKRCQLSSLPQCLWWRDRWLLDLCHWQWLLRCHPAVPRGLLSPEPHNTI